MAGNDPHESQKKQSDPDEAQQQDVKPSKVAHGTGSKEDAGDQHWESGRQQANQPGPQGPSGS